MIRLAALAFLVLVLSFYSFRNWYFSLCGLVLLTALSQHPDMPHRMLGVPGLNPWTLLFAAVILGYLRDRLPRSSERLPRRVTTPLKAYVVLIILVGGLRAILDSGPLREYGWSRTDLVLDLIVNPLKYILLGFLMYEGARDRPRLKTGVVTLLLFCLIHSLLMYKTMRGVIFFGDYQDARRLAPKAIGLHPVDLAGLLSVGFWWFVVASSLVKGKLRWLSALGAVVTFPTLVGCHSRAAFLACGLVGLVLGVVRWRRILLLAPFILMGVLAVFPQVRERMLQDLASDEESEKVDWNTVTAGRTYNVWEPTFRQVWHAPLFGHGRLGIARAKCSETILEREGGVPGHPHNSYLEIWLDCGLVGLGIVAALLVRVGRMAFRLLRESRDLLSAVLGGMGLVALLHVGALGISSSFFYPKESMLWSVCCVALVLRAWTMTRPERDAAGSSKSSASEDGR